mmetsp:Transcript_19050/g.27603  ORF Transcript_19050/g.27603 Transcript_19050/m.27603 type:complete len:82 (+) Transcript_19050:197-442(+)
MAEPKLKRFYGNHLTFWIKILVHVSLDYMNLIGKLTKVIFRFISTEVSRTQNVADLAGYKKLFERTRKSRFLDRDKEISND